MPPSSPPPAPARPPAACSTPALPEAAQPTLALHSHGDGPAQADLSPAGPAGRYQVGRELGVGGMGAVYEAWDPSLRRVVAVKLARDPDASAGVRARFLSEAQIASQLEHPNIVPVYDLGQNAWSSPYFVMRRVEGRSLGGVLLALRRGEEADRRYWTPRRLLNVFIQAGQAVAYAHERGVIHRDLKPDNLMLGPFGEVLLMDWGLARLRGAPDDGPVGRVEIPYRPGTQDGVAIGTPGYMSPEQARGQRDTLDPRTDVWSLGSILYEILTGVPAYPGASPEEVMRATLAGPPPDPLERAPDRAIPPELAAICMRALEADPDRRHPTAKALIDDVEQWLDGSQRRAAAAEKLVEGEAFWARFQELVAQGDALAEQERIGADQLDPWETGHRKDAWLALRDEREQVEVEASVAFARVVAMGERALSFDPGNPDARAFLARAYWWQLEDAERKGQTGERAYFADRVREYDDGAYASRLDGDGRLTLRTVPTGALVVVRRVIQRGLAWALGEPRVLGSAPLLRSRLEAGSYVLTLRYPGRRDTLYPVHITRGRHWEEAPVPLYAEDALGADFVYVPGGPFLVGGDPEASRGLDPGELRVVGFACARYPVRAREYAEFLNALDPDEARRRCPRRDRGLTTSGAPYWRVPAPGERWEVPTTDADADRWHPDWPVFAVSWHDARAYAAWRSARDGVTYDLPTEREWEKAARGVDGRFFPWGSRFDPTAAKTETSRPGRPQPEPVGAFPLDQSPYGVRDLAGGVREWCRDEDYDGDPARRPVRGGCWVGSEKLARAANRFGFEPDAVHGYIGFRLVRRLEPPR